MQIASRRAGGDFDGFRTGPEPLAWASAFPWHRSQAMPCCEKRGSGYLFSVPGAGGWNPLVWQWKQETAAGKFSGMCVADLYAGVMSQVLLCAYQLTGDSKTKPSSEKRYVRPRCPEPMK